jgi:ribonuclease HI
MHRRVPADQLITYDAEKQVSQLQLLPPRTQAIVLDPLTLVVRIDGACRDNGKPSARAAWGVYLGPNSRYNASGRVPADVAQTSSRAEIEALTQAMDIIARIGAEQFPLHILHIVSDSEYLVKGMAVWMPDWIGNGGRTSRGRQAAHFSVLKGIHERIDEIVRPRRRVRLQVLACSEGGEPGG